MARIDWVERRLENWALWKDRQKSGGLGFATQSVFADGPAARGPGWCGETRIPHDEIEASITDDAVEAMRISHGHLHKTVTLYYLQGQGIKGTARSMGRAESTVHAQLGQIDAFVAGWLDDRKRRIAAKGPAAANAPALMDRVAGYSPALDRHLAIRDQVRKERKAARKGAKGRKRAPVVRTSEAPTELVGPPQLRRARSILRLKGRATNEGNA